MTASCTSCGTVLSRRLRLKVARGEPTTGLCAPCWRDSIRAAPRHCCDCGTRIANRKAKRCHPCVNRLMAADETREARRLALMSEALACPGVAERRANACRAAARRKMRWLPDEYREEYFRLLNKLGRAELARAAIRARMTPFERQLSRVLGGEVGIVANERIRRPDPAFTLGGVTGALL